MLDDLRRQYQWLWQRMSELSWQFEGICGAIKEAEVGSVHYLLLSQRAYECDQQIKQYAREWVEVGKRLGL